MRFALFEAIREKSNYERYGGFLSCAQTILAKHGRLTTPFSGIVLCCLSSDTALFGELVSEAGFHEIAYKVHYFQGEPLIFQSHSFD